MILYFANRAFDILGLATNNLPKGFKIEDDLKTQEIESGTVTLEFTLLYNKKEKNKAEKLTFPGNYILKKTGDSYEFYTIIDSDIDNATNSIYIYSEDAGLDLLNEVTDSKYEENSTAYNLKHYLDYLLYDSGFIIGVNEIPNDRKRTLQLSAGTTMTAAIQSVVNSFDGEISFDFDIKGLRITKKRINIHQKRGVSNAAILTMNKEIENIIQKRSIADLATAYRVTGGIPDGEENPITLKGYEYDDGDYYVDSEGWLRCRSSTSKWSRYLSESGYEGNVGAIVKNYENTFITDKKWLLSSALKSLKEISDVSLNYEIDISLLPKNVKIGDRINIVDEDNKLYLEARVLKLEISEANETYKATLGEYVKKKSDISSKVQNLSEEFVKIAKKRQLYTWIVYADDDKGNGITVESYNKPYIGISYNHTKKQDPIESIKDKTIYTWVKILGDPGQTFYTWIKYADSDKGLNMSDDPTGKIYMGIAYNKDLPADQTDESDDPTKYKWSLIQGDEGESLYTWIMYADDAKGTNMSESPANKEYIGVAYNKATNVKSTNPSDYKWTKIKGEKGSSVTSIIYQYYLSLSNETLSGGIWTEEQPIWDKNKYVWMRTKSTYDDGRVTYSEPSLADMINGTFMSINDIIEKGGFEYTSNNTNLLYSGSCTDFGIEVRKIVGNTIQNGTPTPEKEIALQSTKFGKTHSRSRNLLNSTIENGTINGITITKFDNGLIKLNGTCTTEGTYIWFYGNGSSTTYIFPFTCTFSSGLKSTIEGFKFIFMKGSTTLATSEANGITTIKSPTSIGIRLSKDVKLNDLVISPMLNQGTKPFDEYVSPKFENDYDATNIILRCSPDGTADVYEEGVITRKNNVVEFTGTDSEAWTLIDSKNGFTRFGIILTDGTVESLMCNKLKAVVGVPSTYTEECIIRFNNSSTVRIILSNDRASTIDELRAFLKTSSLKVMYKYKTPIKENVDPITFDTLLDYANIYVESGMVPKSTTLFIRTSLGSKTYLDTIKDELEKVESSFDSKIESLQDSNRLTVDEMKKLINDNITAISSATSSITQTSESVELVLSKVSDIADNISGLASKEEIHKWARFEDGILTLGESNSPYCVKLSTTELGFYQSGTKIAYISNQQLHISQAVILDKINLGSYSIEYDANIGFIIH